VERKTQWAAIVSIASKIGCAAETLRKWVRQAERDQGQRDGLSSSERLAEADVEPSVGSVGDSYDNALAETIIGLYKTEVIHRSGVRVDA
jgi:transposase-like protein